MKSNIPGLDDGDELPEDHDEDDEDEEGIEEALRRDESPDSEFISLEELERRIKKLVS
jgi:hypothetical protein